MAGRDDFTFAEVLVELKNKYPQILLVAVLAHENQAVNWPERDRNRFFSLMEKCDEELHFQVKPSQGCEIGRNRYLIGRSGMLLTLCGGVLSPALQAVSYAKKLGRQVICIPRPRIIPGEFLQLLQKQAPASF